MSLDCWRMKEGCTGDYPVENAVTEEFKALVGGRGAMMRRMCNCFYEQGRELEVMANDGLKGLVYRRQSHLNVIRSV